jgi:hypothetical protein
MAARGMGGSGMDLVAQLQASQAATEREALAGLERNAAQEQNRANSSAQAGGLAGNIRGQAFGENSAKAQAQDAINRFNTANSVNRSMYNNRGMNDVNAQNVTRNNQTLDKNTDAKYGFRKDAYGVQNNQYNQNYNAATEDLNQKRIQDEQARARKQAQISGITTLAGAGIGAATAGPGGAMKGASYGAGIGNAAGGAFYAKGGKVPEDYASGGYVNAPEVVPWDDEANDIKQINVSGGEIVIPKSIANDPLASAQFVDRENRKQMQAARSQQDMMGLGNILGKAATDYGNAQNQGVVLANRMQDLGQKPAMYQTEKKQYDSSVLDNLGKMGVDRASEDAKQREKSFGRDVELKKMADEKAILASKRDPNSEESLMARSMLAEMAPQFAKNTPGFANLSAERLEQIYPKLRDKMDFDQRASINAQNFGLEKQKLGAQQANTQAQLELKRAMDERERSETSNKRGFDNLPEDSKITIKALSANNANKEAISSQIEAVFSRWDTLSDSEKLQQGRQLIKTLNSTQGSDAVGAEEAKRLAGKLEFTLGNFFNSEPTQFGRDIEGFKKDAETTVAGIRDAMKSNQAVIDKAYGRSNSQAQHGASGNWRDY